MFQPIDSAARQQAIDCTHSYCVTAPAGSGKTELLTQRFLRLLGRVERPEQLLALTFTRKAAAEMRERILSALRLAQLGNMPDETHRRQTFELAQNALSNSEKRGWRLLDFPSRLNIRTLDSLCQSIVKDQPLMSGAGGRLQPVDNEDALYFKAIDNFLLECADPKAVSETVYSAVSRLLLLVDNNIAKLRELLRDMLPFRDQWLGHAGVYKAAEQREQLLNAILRKRIEQALSEAREALKPYEDKIVPAALFSAEHIAQVESDPKKVEHFESLKGLRELPSSDQQSAIIWRALIDLLFKADLQPRRQLIKSQGFPPKTFFKNDPDKLDACLTHKENLMAAGKAIASDEAGMRAIQTLVSLPLAGYEEDQLQLLEAMVDSLFRVVAHLKLVFAQTGRCDHLEVTASALQSLTAQDDLPETSVDDGIAYRWCEKFHHILVDEFQDTSLSQFELLQSLTRDWNEFNALNPDCAKTLFLVGDGMQSIYSFRAAKVGLFLKARETGIGDIKLQALYLQQNFRSNASVVHWVNHCFSQVFPSVNNVNSGAVCYESATPVNSNNTESGNDRATLQGVETHVFLGALNSDNEEETNADVQLRLSVAESDAIVELIQEEQKTAIETKDSDVDIAVLVRARSHLRSLLPALDSAGIRWEGVDIDALTDRESIMDCMTLTRALMNPIDDLAWYSLLRSPLAGIKLWDMQVLSDVVAAHALPSISLLLTDASAWQRYGSKLAFSSETEGERVLRIVALLQLIYSRRSEFVLSDWLQYSWQLLGGEHVARFAFSGDERGAVQDYFSLVEGLTQRAESSGSLPSYSEIEAGVERLFASSASAIETATQHVTHYNGAKSSQDDYPTVKIMTMHKSKGLEFDVVILPQLHRIPAPESSPMLISHEYLFDDDTSGLLLYPQDKRQLLDADNPQKMPSLYKHLREEKKYARELETARLLYVAATRARRRLWLSGCALENESASEQGVSVATEANQWNADEIKPPASSSLLAKIWPSLVANNELIVHRVQTNAVCASTSEPVTSQSDNAFYASGTIRRLPCEALNNIPESAEKPRITHSNREQLADQDSVAESRRQASISSGVLIHELLELVSLDGFDRWQTRNIADLAPAWRQRLLQLACPPLLVDDTLTTVFRAIRTVLTSSYCHWLFDTTHRSVRAEWRLRTRVFERGRQSATQLVLDRSFIDHDNIRWIIDFKSSEPIADESVEDFLRRELETYRPQLDAYCAAVKQYDSEQNPNVLSTRCALYFPLIDQYILVNEV